MSWRDKIAAVLAGKVGGPTPGGIHVYHSSPHDFDKFDLSKIGTGEGAQVYGHGIYVAENPAVSGQGGQYWQQFMGRHPPDEQSATKLLQQHGFDRAKAAEDAQKHIDTMQKYIRDPANAQDALLPAYERGLPAYQRQLELLQSGAPVGPRTYEVNFRAKPEELLDWDKPLRQQPTNVRDFLESVPKNQWGHGPLDRFMTDPGGVEGVKGSDIYSNLGFWGRVGKPEVSAELASAGIPGIRYLDEGSRGDPFKVRPGLTLDNKLTVVGPNDTFVPFADKVAAEAFASAKNAAHPRTHNYVAFDPSKLDIMAKYGVVGGVPLGAATMGGTVDQSSYGARQ
jgi:hypothetical protein